jgi:hypothetical protein
MLGLNARAWEHLRTLADVCDPRQVQRRLLADLRALSAEYVRSPAFFALMRWQLKAMAASPQLWSPFRYR